MNQCVKEEPRSDKKKVTFEETPPPKPANFNSFVYSATPNEEVIYERKSVQKPERQSNRLKWMDRVAQTDRVEYERSRETPSESSFNQLHTYDQRPAFGSRRQNAYDEYNFRAFNRELIKDNLDSVDSPMHKIGNSKAEYHRSSQNSPVKQLKKYEPIKYSYSDEKTSNKRPHVYLNANTSHITMESAQYGRNCDVEQRLKTVHSGVGSKGPLYVRYSKENSVLSFKPTKSLNDHFEIPKQRTQDYPQPKMEQEKMGGRNRAIRVFDNSTTYAKNRVSCDIDNDYYGKDMQDSRNTHKFMFEPKPQISVPEVDDYIRRKNVKDTCTKNSYAIVSIFNLNLLIQRTKSLRSVQRNNPQEAEKLS